MQHGFIRTTQYSDRLVQMWTTGAICRVAHTEVSICDGSRYFWNVSACFLGDDGTPVPRETSDDLGVDLWVDNRPSFAWMTPVDVSIDAPVRLRTSIRTRYRGCSHDHGWRSWGTALGCAILSDSHSGWTTKHGLGANAFWNMVNEILKICSTYMYAVKEIHNTIIVTTKK